MRVMVLILVVLAAVAVVDADDFLIDESNMAFLLNESRFVVEDVPTNAGHKETVEFVMENLGKQFDVLRGKFLQAVETSLTEGEARGVQIRRCHTTYNVNGDLMWCEGNPYDCLCVYVYAPPG